LDISYQAIIKSKLETIRVFQNIVTSNNQMNRDKNIKKGDFLYVKGAHLKTFTLQIDAKVQKKIAEYH
jgi:hypothetical protein